MTTTYTVTRYHSDGTVHTARTYSRGHAAAMRLDMMAYEMIGDSADRDTHDGHRVMADAANFGEAVTRGGLTSGTIHSRGRRLVIVRTMEGGTIDAAPSGERFQLTADAHPSFPVRTGVIEATLSPQLAGDDATVRVRFDGESAPRFVRPSAIEAENDVLPTADGFVVRDAAGLVCDDAGRAVRFETADEAKAFRRAPRRNSADTRPASVVALESLNVAICAAALDRAGLPADTALPTAPRAYLDAYATIMCERRGEVFSAIEAAGKDAAGNARHFVDGMAAAYARATAPRVATDGAGYQNTAHEAVVAAPAADSYWNKAKFPHFICHRGNWDLYSDDTGYCASIPAALAPAGCKASHFGDRDYVRVTLGIDPLAIVTAPAAVSTIHAANVARVSDTGRDADAVLQDLATAVDEAIAPTMVATPCQQQQAKARGRAPQPARGERRYVTVRDTETGDVHRVLTSVARVGVAVIIFTPSNRHREGALGGMLITHDDVRKAWVFNDEAEARRFLTHSRPTGERRIRAELIADPAVA